MSEDRQDKEVCLKDSKIFELFPDNKVNDDGDFVHFALMDESEPVKTEEVLSDPKRICDMKGEVEVQGVLVADSLTWSKMQAVDASAMNTGGYGLDSCS
ncbi:hypothetical protein KIW84_052458 [Lathyrus oleraceus]|uniref:Uncharacterized protein n=1 Tax=Pisum sativum TaxID=3888 RepID=A0A9D5AEX7_PEA|nr:hypothetical protein KIW84_052458 [Pisum sativum]